MTYVAENLWVVQSFLKFKIKRNGNSIPNGLLVYEITNRNQNSNDLYSDRLNGSGEASTSWTENWLNQTIEVHCHTDGINKGKPAFCGTVLLRPNEYYVLSC